MLKQIQLPKFTARPAYSSTFIRRRRFSGDPMAIPCANCREGHDAAAPNHREHLPMTGRLLNQFDKHSPAHTALSFMRC